MGGTSLKSAVGVGNGASGVVVELNLAHQHGRAFVRSSHSDATYVSLNVAADNASERADEVVDLSGAGATDGVGNTDSVDADLVDGAVDGKQIDEVGTEGVLRGETDLETLGLDELDNLNGSLFIKAVSKSLRDSELKSDPR